MHIEIGRSAELIAAAQSIRHQVFVIEQAIPCQLERDGLDSCSFHLVMSQEGQAIATARFWISKYHGVMARVAVVKEYRRAGVGRQLIKALMSHGHKLGLTTISIQAHAYLRGYYEQFGFVFINDVANAGEHPLIAMEYRYKSAS